MSEEDNARKAFEKFSKPEGSKGDEKADKIIALDEDDPILGAVAFAYKDEVEAVEGYKRIAPMFKDDQKTLYQIANIISDEERHMSILEEIATRYALRKGMTPDESTAHFLNKILGEKEVTTEGGQVSEKKED